MSDEAKLMAGVQAAIATAIGADEDELTPDKKIFKELGVDSVDFLDISYEVERDTGLDIASMFQDEKLDADLTIQGLVDLLKAKIQAAQG